MHKSIQKDPSVLGELIDFEKSIGFGKLIDFVVDFRVGKTRGGRQEIFLACAPSNRKTPDFSVIYLQERYIYFSIANALKKLQLEITLENS
jgi:hypothetical protein